MFHNLVQEHQQRDTKLTTTKKPVNSESYLQVTVCFKIHYFDKHRSQWTTSQVPRV